MIPNIKHAKKHFNDDAFAPYSTAYVTTNEDLRNALKCMPKDTNRALTVAASGDHPIFVKLYGAKYVDTFDISLNARLIMDIKTSALSLLNHQEYCELLKNLYKSKDIMLVKNMSQIIRTLTSFEQKYIKEMRGENLFNKEIRPDSMLFPTNAEFQKMRQIINKPFNFVWSDIKTLHKKLKRNYDFMHLSNIFDYVGTYQDCMDVLDSLASRTNPGGSICFVCFNKDPEAICEKFMWTHAMQHNQEQAWTANPVFEIKNSTYVMHRVR